MNPLGKLPGGNFSAGTSAWASSTFAAVPPMPSAARLASFANARRENLSNTCHAPRICSGAGAICSKRTGRTTRVLEIDGRSLRATRFAQRYRDRDAPHSHRLDLHAQLGLTEAFAPPAEFARGLTTEEQKKRGAGRDWIPDPQTRAQGGCSTCCSLP